MKIAKASLDGFSFLCYNGVQAEKRLKCILVYCVGEIAPAKAAKEIL